MGCSPVGYFILGERQDVLSGSDSALSCHAQASSKHAAATVLRVNFDV